MVKKLILCAAVFLSGCASGVLENRVYCSADKQDLVFMSWWANFGVGAKVAPKDAVLCQKGEPK